MFYECNLTRKKLLWGLKTILMGVFLRNVIYTDTPNIDFINIEHKLLPAHRWRGVRSGYDLLNSTVIGYLSDAVSLFKHESLKKMLDPITHMLVQPATTLETISLMAHSPSQSANLLTFEWCGCSFIVGYTGLYYDRDKGPDCLRVPAGKTFASFIFESKSPGLYVPDESNDKPSYKWTHK